MTFLRAVLGNNFGSLLEIGGNRRGEFFEVIGPHCSSYVNCEINNEVSSDTVSIDQLGDRSADVICAYYVFEHIVDLISLLASCSRILKDQGRLIIEVPDISYYPHISDALAFHEHVNHFSVRTLNSLLSKCGFDLAALSREHTSSLFGFVAAFKKSEAAGQKSKDMKDIVEYNDATALLRAGHQRILRERAHLASARSKIVEWLIQGDQVVFWGASEITLGTIGGVILPGSYVLIDINPNKKDFVPGHIANRPSECEQAIKCATRLVIFTEHGAESVMKQVRQIRGNKIPVSVIVTPRNSGGFVYLN